MVTVTLFSPLTFVSRKGDNRLGEGACLAPLVLWCRAPYALPSPYKEVLRHTESSRNCVVSAPLQCPCTRALTVCVHLPAPGVSYSLTGCRVSRG